MPQKNTTIKYALLNALWTALYIIFIAMFMNHAQAFFGDGKTVLIPIMMLLLFVFSATLCGALVLGRPVLWYLDGKKKDALVLFAYTLGILFVLTVIMMVLLYVLK